MLTLKKGLDLTKRPHHPTVRLVSVHDIIPLTFMGQTHLVCLAPKPVVGYQPEWVKNILKETK